MKKDPNNITQESNLIKDYFKLGWELYKDYYKPLIGAQLLALITFICVSLISITIYIIILLSFSPLEQLLKITDLTGIIFLGFMIPGFICLVAFIGSLFGMSNEIMSSGDYYTELKSSFTYFRKYWWQYFLIALCSLFCFLIAIVIANLLSIIVSHLIPVSPMIIFPIILYSVLSLFETLVFLFPVALTSTGSLKKALNQTISLLKNNPKVYLTVFAIFFILSISIDILLDVLEFYYNDSLIVLSFLLLLSCVSFFIIFPYAILVSTIIYHSIFNQEGLNGKEKK